MPDEPTWRRSLGRCLTAFRQVVGMPDYDRYVRHLRLAHPGRPIPSEREFFELYLKARYGEGPTRCC
ncbi:MAG TPA: YbdD/YjiX family protein [Gemmatimonadales bacterium]|nr:YbdD/YjiX family protein [Gemmatimonadales bacterium]